MARKIYKRTGLRRDRSFTDLNDPTISLNNLLDNLVDDKTNKSFISEDLNCIRGISSLGLKNSNYRELIGSSSFFTTNTGSLTEFFPRITYKNKIDKFKLFSGEPRLNGGNGLTAKYYNPNQIYENTVGIFSGAPFKIDNFWEDGQFNYTGKITPESINVNGGVEWEGYFIPTQSGRHTFYIDTSALMTFDFQPESEIIPSKQINFFVTRDADISDNITFTSSTNQPITFDGNNLGIQTRTTFYNDEYKVTGNGTIQIFDFGKKIGLDDNPPSGKDNDYNDLTVTAPEGYFYNKGNDIYYRLDSYGEISRIGLTTSIVGSGTSGTNIVTIGIKSETKYIGVGQSVSAVGIATGSIVKSYNIDTGNVELTPPVGLNTSVYSNINGNITFSKTIGQSTQISHLTYVLKAYEKYRIKIRYFIPSSIDAVSAQRFFNITFSTPTSGLGRLRYTNLYGLDYDFAEKSKGYFNTFLNNSISFGGGIVGKNDNVNNYVKVLTTNKIDIKYSPKSSINEITKASRTASITNGTSIMSISDTSNIEVGNYIFGSGLADKTRVEQIQINSFIILDKPANLTTSGTYTFIDHRGFFLKITGTANAGIITSTSTDFNTIEKGMVVIGTGVSSYTVVKTKIGGTTVEPTQTFSERDLYVYYSKGLINNSLKNFCSSETVKCLITTTTTPQNSTSIPVSDTSDINVNSYVYGYQFDSGTQISSVGTNSITINKPTIQNLPEGANFTVTNTNESKKALCCPPTDTSPPFNPTLEGLETISTAPNLELSSGNIIFNSFRANMNSGDIISISNLGTENCGSYIPIKIQNTTYKILCV